MAHQVDQFGYPLDPELRHLERRLGQLAGEWGRVAHGIGHQEAIVAEYHATMQRMYDLGWRGGLDIDAELPHDLMPAWYMEQDLIPSPTHGDSDHD